MHVPTMEMTLKTLAIQPILHAALVAADRYLYRLLAMRILFRLFLWEDASPIVTTIVTAALV